MSTTDERVVSLKFDNQNFEENVNTSLSSLEKLNKSIDFTNHKKGGKGFEEISKTVKATDFSGMEKNVNTIASRFSNLGIVGVTALTNITNSAVNAGKNLVKSLTIKPVKMGLDEYELKMGSMRTILASTRNEFKSEGEAIQTISKHLNELNKYSDETIYSFSDMTSNIGKFTNAGVKLDVAVQAIKGISNEAAISGANAQEASRAMYNFSQALSAGYVKLIDWKSIENANMATKEFKEQLIETAVATGNLTKKGDVYLTSKGKEITATKNFNESLQDQWMTTEVLTTTLNNYATDVSKMSDEEKRAYEEKLKGIGYTEDQIKKIEETGTKAYQAASEITTWSKLVDTLQESVQSGWAQTFELLFGNIKEATALWTGIGNALSSFIGKMSDARNLMLKEWKEAGGRTALLNGIANVLKYIGSLLKPIGQAFREIFPPASGKALAEASKKFEAFSKKLKASDETVKNIKDTFKGLFSIVGLVKHTFISLVKAIAPAGSSVGSFGQILFSVTGAIGRIITTTANWIEKTGIIEGALAKVGSVIRSVMTMIKEFAEGIEHVLTPADDKATGKEGPIQSLAHDLSTLGDATNKAESCVKPLEKIKEVFDGLGESKGVESFGEGLKNAFGQIDGGTMTTALFQILKVLGLASLVKKIAEKFGKKSLLHIIKKPFEASASAVSELTDVFKSIGESFTQLSGILKATKRNIQFQSFKIIAAAVLMLSTAVYILSKISVPDMKKALIALTYISALFVAMSKILSSDSISAAKLAASAASFMSLSISINLIAIAAKILASMSVTDLVKAGAAMAAFMLVLTKITTSLTGSLRGALSFALVATAVGTGMSLLVPAIVVMSKLSVASIVKSAASIVSFIVLIMKASQLVGKDKINTMQFVAISFAVSALVPAITILSKLPFAGALKAAATLGLVIASIALASRTISAERISIVSFIVVAAGVKMIAPAIIALAQLPFGQAAKAAASLGMVLTALTASIKILGASGSKGALGTSAMLLAMSVAVRSMGSALISLAQVPFSSLLKAAVALSGTMAALALAGKIAIGSKKNMLVMAAVLGILSFVVKGMGEVDTGDAIKNMAGLSQLIVVIGFTASMMTKVPIGGALAALEKFAIFLAGVTVIVTALGALASKWDSFEEYLKKGAKLGKYLGDFVGGLIGGIIGGFTAGVSEGLVVLGKNLSAFMTSLKPFLDGAKGVDNDTVNCIKNLAKAILYLTAADLLNALNSTPLNVFSGGGMVSFAEDLGKFVDALKPIGEKADKIPNLEQLSAVADAAGKLGEAAAKIPAVGGIRGAIMGVHDLGKFGEQLGTFIGTLSVMKSFGFELTKKDINTITRITVAITKLGEAANSIPETTFSLKGLVTGMKDLGLFAQQLTDFAPKFSDFVESVTDNKNISKKSLSKVTALAEAVAALGVAANKIPEELDPDSLDAKINGIKDLPRFADGITKISSKMPELIAASKDMNQKTTAKIKMMADVISMLADAAKRIDQLGGKKGGLGKSARDVLDKLSDFTDKMKEYVPGFKEFTNSAKTIDDKDLEKATTVTKGISRVVKAAATLRDAKGGGNGEDLKGALTNLSAGIKKYAKVMKDIDVEDVVSKSESIASSVKSVSKQLNKKTDTKTSAANSVKQYISGLKSGDAVKNASSNAAAIRKAATDALKKTESFKSAGTKCANAFAAGLKSTSKASANGKSLGTAGANGAKSADFKGAGASGASGFASGLRGGVQDVASAGTALGEAAYKAAKKALKSKSPSKKFMELGRFGALGLAIGLEEYSAKVYQAGKKVGIAGLNGSKQALSDIDMALTDPRIKPVIDLSNVKRGADRINDILNNSATINTPIIESAIQRQNGAQMTEMIDKLATIVQTSSEQPSGDTVNIGDVTLDVSKLEDVATIEDFVNILTTAKSIA